jgi:hypothetical protein
MRSFYSHFTPVLRATPSLNCPKTFRTPKYEEQSLTAIGEIVGCTSQPMPPPDFLKCALDKAMRQTMIR